MTTNNIVWTIVSVQLGIVDDVWTFSDETEAREEFDRLRLAWMESNSLHVSERLWQQYLEESHDDMQLFRTRVR